MADPAHSTLGRMPTTGRREHREYGPLVAAEI
jgi:hypothetical protein